jgi:hypothetical protein
MPSDPALGPPPSLTPAPASPAGSPRDPPKDDDDHLDDLPPLDGDDEEPPESAPAPDLDESIAAGSDSLDDSTGEDDAVDPDEIEPLARESTWVDEPADAADLDLGDTELAHFDDDRAGADDADEPAIATDDFSFGESPERVGLDAGDEGPIDADEELRDEDLPAFDADDEGEPDAAGFWDEKLIAEGPTGVPWAPRPWASVGAPLPLSRVRGLVCVPRGALVAAQTDAPAPSDAGQRRARGGGPATELARVDLEGTVDVVDTSELGEGVEIEAVAASGDWMAVVSSDGRLFVSENASPRFERRAEALAAADAVALGEETIWLRTRSGGLAVSTDRALSFARCAVPGRVVAISANGTAAIGALVVDDGDRPVAILRGANDGTVAREPIEAPALAAPAAWAVRGSLVAYAGIGGMVRRGADGVWRTFPWEGRATAAVFIDAAGTLLVATYSEADDATSLVCLDPAGKASVVARAGSAPEHSDADGQVIALACDDSRGVVWLAGGVGVAAFAIGAQALATE